MAQSPSMAPLLALALVLLCAPSALAGNYNYSEAGTDWPGLCQTGEFQSPINIVTRRAEAAPYRLQLSTAVGRPIKLVNTGTNINLYPDPRTPNTLTFNGKRYTLLQVHAHAVSEHAFDGLFTAVELHLVHTREGNSSELLVLGVPLRLNDNDTSNWFLKLWLDSAPEEHNTTVIVNKPLDIYSLVQRPANRRLRTFYTYPGSLTTPACTQGVTWLVLDPRHAPTVSVAQLVNFEVLISRTAHGVPETMRPPRPLNNRKVLKFDEML